MRVINGTWYCTVTVIGQEILNPESVSLNVFAWRPNLLEIQGSEGCYIVKQQGRVCGNVRSGKRNPFCLLFVEEYIHRSSKLL
jgi:hypothetical protein